MDLRWLGTAALTAAALFGAAAAPARAELLFQDSRNGQNQLRVMSDALDGSSTALFAGSTQLDQQASVSADRTKVVFESTEGGWFDVWAAGLDGSGRQQVGGLPSATDGLPTFAPDGDRFAFQTDREGDYDIYVGDISGTSELPITVECDGNESDPDWHPTQDLVVFQSNCAGGNRLFVADLAAGGAQELTPGGYHTEAKWSPDGTKIAWTDESSGDADVWVMDADGANQRRVNGDNFAVDRAPAWSPDGSRVVFVSNRSGGYEIWSAPAAGGIEVRHTDNLHAEGGLDWVGTSTTVPPTLTVEDAKGSEGGPVRFTLALDRPAAGGEHVALSTAPGTATGGDFAGLDGQVVTFEAGATEATVDVSTEQDSEFELEEHFDLLVHDAVGVGVSTAQARGTIDSDDPFPQGESGWLAYECDQSGLQDICLRDVASQYTYNLTNSLDAEYSPKVSPDGTRIAFQRGGDIVTREIDGGSERVIAQGTQPDWFPSGDRVLFTFDTGAGQRLHSATDTASPGITEITGAADPYAEYGEVSPDGTQIAYSCRLDGASSHNREICTVGADGTGNQARTSYGGTLAAFDPAWSPDSQSIAFHVDDNGGNSYEAELHRISADGSGQAVIDSTDGFEARSATWSPDGLRVAFNTQEIASGTRTIQAVDAAGGNRGELVPGSAVPGAPDWWAFTLPTVSVADAAVPEGPAAGTRTLRFTLTLNRPAAGGEQVTVAADPDTAQDGDFDAFTENVVTFAPGELTRAVDVTVHGDDTFEPDERLLVSLFNASGLDIAVPTAVGTIENDDAFPVDDGIVAYRCNFGEICLRAGAGGTPVQITSGGGYDDPEISPDGTRIAFRINSFQIGAMDLDGGSLRILGAGDDPTWFPDSELMAYSHDSGTGMRVWTVRDVASPAPAPLTAALSGFTLSPDVAPDGSQIVLSGREEEASSLNRELYLVNADGTNLRPLTAYGVDAAATFPEFSPDGSRIAFVFHGSDAGPEEYELRTLAADGSDPQTLESGTLAFESPTWSPDGARVAYYRMGLGVDESPPEISVIGADGVGRQTLIPTATPAPAAPSWYRSSAPAASISDATAGEGEPAVFTVSLSAPAPTGGVSVGFATVPAASGDYTGRTGTLTIAAGETEGVIEVQTTEDDIDEPDETFAVELSDPQGVTLADASGTATITDDDGPPVITIADGTATEGGLLQFQVTLSNRSSSPVGFQWTTSTATGTAEPGDFTAANGQNVQIAAGATGIVLTTSTFQDDDFDDETLHVTLTNPTNATLGADVVALGTIEDDDVAPVEPTPQPTPEPTPEPTAEPRPPQPTPQPTPTPTPVPQEPQPEPNRSVVAEPVRGKVLVKLPGSAIFVDLAEVKEIPNGTVIDARRGRVEIRAARGGPDDVAIFYAGIFKVSQVRGITILRLQGKIGPCRASARRASAAAKRRKKKRRLWGSGKGRFRTAGKYASATVRGTTWLVEDSCSGTLTRVRQGSVTVRDNVKRRNVVVKKGRRYLARPRRR